MLTKPWSLGVFPSALIFGITDDDDEDFVPSSARDPITIGMVRRSSTSITYKTYGCVVVTYLTRQFDDDLTTRASRSSRSDTKDTHHQRILDTILFCSFMLWSDHLLIASPLAEEMVSTWNIFSKKFSVTKNNKIITPKTNALCKNTSQVW